MGLDYVRKWRNSLCFIKHSSLIPFLGHRFVYLGCPAQMFFSLTPRFRLPCRWLHASFILVYFGNAFRLFVQTGLYDQSSSRLVDFELFFGFKFINRYWSYSYWVLQVQVSLHVRTKILILITAYHELCTGAGAKSEDLPRRFWFDRHLQGRENDDWALLYCSRQWCWNTCSSFL